MTTYPFDNATESIVVNTIRIVKGFLQDVTDEIGNPLPVEVRSIRSISEIEEPEVTISLRLGIAPFGLGRNILSIDYDGESVDYGGNTGITYGFMARNSHLVLAVNARSDAERHFITDNIINGIVASYATYQGQDWDGAVADEFAEIGVVLKGIDEVRFDMPILSGARPHGQIYTATIDLLCDVWVTWNNDQGYTPSEITVQSTLISNPTSDGGNDPVLPDVPLNPLSI